MPMYEFHCGDCAAVFETLCTYAEAEVGMGCPACGTGWGARVDSLPASPRRAGASVSAGAPAPAAGGHPAGCGCALHRARPRVAAKPS
jgi:putative FmdB family regulatory protein